MRQHSEAAQLGSTVSEHNELLTRTTGCRRHRIKGAQDDRTQDEGGTGCWVPGALVGARVGASVEPEPEPLVEPEPEPLVEPEPEPLANADQPIGARVGALVSALVV